MKISRLFFDIETLANPETCELMPDPKPAANLRDPEKIAADIEEKRRNQIESAALDPDYGKILSIGMSINGELPTVLVNADVFGHGLSNALSEQGLLMAFWNTYMSCFGYCVGYNILGFDLPYLMRRSMALGVPISRTPNLAKFRTDPVTDLMAILYNWGSDRYKGLKQVAKLYGINNPCPDLDGSKVAGLDVHTLIPYQASDVTMVVELYRRMNGIYFTH